MRNKLRLPRPPLPAIGSVNVIDAEFSGVNDTKCENVSKFTNEKGEWQFMFIDREDEQGGGGIPSVVAEKIKINLDTHGMDIIRGAVDRATIDMLRYGNVDTGTSHPDAELLQEVGEAGKKKVLSESQGSGITGEAIYTRIMTNNTEQCGSSYDQLQKSVYLDLLQNTIQQSFLSGRVDDINRKYILLKYSKGGENWAHNDANTSKVFPYQALLMLSDRNEYDGGEFYIAKQAGKLDNADVSITRLCTPKLNAGDLVIFRANGSFYHGMKPVTRGERVAIGLLQV
jgi:predicted 2-oxoglutarate/Fe(II)-dependent dioxygenase YbiX